MTNWKKYHGAIIVLAASLILSFLPAHAAEVVRHFHSDIAVEKSGLIKITETIEVNAEGVDIRHGIFRDFPLTRRDGADRLYEVDFKLLSVTRDGVTEPYHTQSIDNGIRIYAGNADFYVPEGVHTYKFTYETDRQIGYYEDADQFYWNITGNFWQFPILTSDADITLPDGTMVNAVHVYTGALGSKGADATNHIDASRVYVTASRPFKTKEGMTVQIDMPPGTIDQPTHMKEWRWWLKDNRNIILGILASVLVWGWYGRAWSKVGRDPPRGVMVPRWDAPDGISPALVNYIDNKGFGGIGWTAFSAAAINLAVKGYIKLDDFDESITVTALKSGLGRELPSGERTIFQRVQIAADHEFRIAKSNGMSVQNLGGEFTSAIEKEHRGKYYQFNVGYIVVGIILSVLSFVAILALGRFSDDGIFMSIFPNVLAVVIGVFAGVFGRGLAKRSLVGKAISIVIFGIAGLLFLGFLGLLFIATGSDLYSTGELPAILAMCGIVIANLIFFFIMGAPTPLGTKMMDGIDGLRHYLTLAEKDRMNMRDAPTMSPQHFETLLPYAVALGVETPWTDTFEKWLATAKLAATYQPVWYHGRDMGSFSRNIGSFSSSMESTIRSTLPAPPPGSSSSSGGGGGSSGGGGGGGGGGGW